MNMEIYRKVKPLHDAMKKALHRRDKPARKSARNQLNQYYRSIGYCDAQEESA